jgi:hypothetical protein
MHGPLGQADKAVAVQQRSSQRPALPTVFRARVPDPSLPAARRTRPVSWQSLGGGLRDSCKLRLAAAYFRRAESASQQSGKTQWPTPWLTRSRDYPGSADLRAGSVEVCCRLIRPAMVTGIMAALIATADTPTVAPLACGITWTRTGVYGSSYPTVRISRRLHNPRRTARRLVPYTTESTINSVGGKFAMRHNRAAMDSAA